MKKIKQIFILITLVMLMIPGFAWAIHDVGYVLNITHKNMIINEINNQVVLPFDQEYKVLLKNTTLHGCTIRLFIDNILVSNMGDFILRTGQELNLERFVGSSLQKGRSFLFVSIEDERVDDPTRKENGIIRAEFYPEDIQIYDGIIEINDDKVMPRYFFKDGCFQNDNVYDTTLYGGSLSIANNNVTFCNSTSAGVTVEGNMSYQKFSKGNIKVKNKPIVLELRIVGINK